MQLLNNLFRVGLKKKNADIIYYMQTSLAFFQQENVKKSVKSIKIIIIDGKYLHTF